jgi:hypothetical protein
MPVPGNPLRQPLTLFALAARSDAAFSGIFPVPQFFGTAQPLLSALLRATAYSAATNRLAVTIQSSMDGVNFVEIGRFPDLVGEVAAVAGDLPIPAGSSIRAFFVVTPAAPQTATFEVLVF